MTPLLFDFYRQFLQDKEWVSPGLDGYFLLNELMESPHFRPKNFQDLAHAMETIWLKSQQHQERFRQLLEERRTLLLEVLAEGERARRGTTALPADLPQNAKAPIAGPSLSAEDPAARYGEKPKEKKAVEETPPKKTPEDRQIDSREVPGFSISYSEGDASDAFVLQQRLEQERQSEVQRPYFFTNDYFPIRNRQLQQAWRSLRAGKEAGQSDDINFPRTIRDKARQGYLFDFAYHRKMANELQLFVLIDESETMVAVENFGREICEAAAASNRYTDLKPLYFNKLPLPGKEGDDYLFSYEALAPYVSLSRLFAPFNKKNILVLIYSDMGVFRNELDPIRVDSTREFIRWLFKRTGYIAWVNPAPKHRWAGTNAGELQDDTPMFEAGKGEFENAIATLKGKFIN
ncbi:MAG TPA: hypothetical protein VI233_11380 [Puia sp.]